MNPLFWFFLLLAMKNGGAGDEPGQGGVRQKLVLKGSNGQSYTLTFFNDRTVFVQTARTAFYAKEGTTQVIKVVLGTQAEVADAIANLPE